MTPQTAWTDGLALLPQHFQNADNHSLERAFRHPGVPASRGFGFQRLRIDGSLLESTRQIRIESCAGVLPGGIPFDTRTSGSSSLVREIPESLGVEHASIRVFLAVPSPLDDAPRIGEQRTFRQVVQRKIDESVGGAAREIPTLIPNLSLRFSTDPQGSMMMLPIGDIIRDAQGRPVFSKETTPLLLDIHASPLLSGFASQLLRLVRSRGSDLGRQNPGNDPAGIRLWLESMLLATSAASLDHLCTLPEVHPERLHEALAVLQSGLAFLRGQPATSTPYDHLQSITSLPRLASEVAGLLQAQHRENNLVRAFAKESPLVQGIQIPPDFLATGKRFILAITTGMGADQFLPLFSQHAKVAPRSRLQAIITSALPGIEARLCSPPTFFRSGGHIFLELSPSGPLWMQLQGEGALCVYSHPSLGIASIELLVEGA